MLITTLSFIGCGDASNPRTDLTDQNLEKESVKWEFIPESGSDIKEGDTVTAIYFGNSKNSYCTSTSDRFISDGSPTVGTDGRIYYTFKIQHVDIDSRTNVDLDCDIKEIYGKGRSSGRIAHYKFKKQS